MDQVSAGEANAPSQARVGVQGAAVVLEILIEKNLLTTIKQMQLQMTDEVPHH
jgi:hypothetical protein